MRHKRLKLSAVLLLGLGLTGLQAQQSINAAGGNATGSGGMVSYSVGQVAYKTHTGTSGSVSEGVQQPYEISVVTAIEKTKGINLSVTAYPNPTTDFLQLKIENEAMKPKAIFADAVSASHTSILVGELAKLLKQNGVNMGANRLFDWLRDKGFLIRRKGTDWNMPIQYSMDLGLFEIKETTIARSDGSISISKTAKVTGKGQQYFINKFLG